MNTFTAHRDICVNNYFQGEDSNLTWAQAFSFASIESVLVFGRDKRLLFYNNRFGTFTGAARTDLVDVDTVLRYLDKYYENVSQVAQIVELPFLTCVPSRFDIRHRCGWMVNCRTVPVLDNYKLSGVMLLAHRQWTNIIEQTPEKST